MAHNNETPRPKKGSHHGMMPGEKAKDFSGSVKKLIKYLGRYWVWIVVVMILAAISTVFAVIGPKIMGKATTELASGLMGKLSGTGGINFDKILEILLFTLFIYGMSALFNFVQNMVMTNITQNTCYRMRKDISKKI